MHAKKRHSARKTAGRPIRGADKIKALSAGSPRAHRRTRPRPRITEAHRPLSWRKHDEVRAMLDAYALPPRRRPTSIGSADARPAAVPLDTAQRLRLAQVKRSTLLIVSARESLAQAFSNRPARPRRRPTP